MSVSGSALMLKVAMMAVWKFGVWLVRNPNDECLVGYRRGEFTGGS